MEYKDELLVGKATEMIDEACQELLKEIQCDFVGLAIQNKRGPDINWRFAAGNLTDKYKRITVRYGKGIAGGVILTGRPMSVNDFPNNIVGKVLEYPIMLAEKLLFSYAVPIHVKGIPKGVLLVGRRTKNIITVEEQLIVQKYANKLDDMLNHLI
ncbi:GAF domain-containing protein [Bacillus sp. 31A1R]|uniref:GAF domain-containing protein n=1 Tax=Robertmurraya mangrovi TaxID=3098077 RepID=A0ABU5IWT8_9BACI|nr:GAF domain-containing protein [Bacillus sp. 31A1R]MDZ5471609.1 GAF domain-containing protein [Bacillus sp. 31A1R]